MSAPDCECCGERPAQCKGAYEGRTEETFSCGDCCGHGNEDGHCRPLCACCGDVLEENDDCYGVTRFPEALFCKQCAEDYESGLHNDPDVGSAP